MKVSKGKVFAFDTNAAAKYGANVKCGVTYRKMKNCKKMQLTCEEFSLAKGDSLRVTRGKNKKT